MPRGKKTTPEKQAAGVVVNEQLTDEIVLQMYSKINRVECNTKEKFLEFVLKQLKFNPSEVDMKNLKERIWRKFFAGGTSANAGTLARVQNLATIADQRLAKQDIIDKAFSLNYEEFCKELPIYAQTLEEMSKKTGISPQNLYLKQQAHTKLQSEEERKKSQSYISVAEQYKIRNGFWAPETSTANSPYRHDALDLGDMPSILDLLSELG